MNRNFRFNDFGILILVFVLSRALMIALGIRMNWQPLLAYWQYLDVETLRHHLLRGVWYDHAQPPAFNLFLGIMLKVSGNQSVLFFAVVFKFISLFNGLLLMSIVRKISPLRFLPLIVALAYLLSPATLIYECELFYTSFISMLLLVSVYFLIRLKTRSTWSNMTGFFLPLVLVCLTRSVYHIAWLSVVIFALLFCFRGTAASRKMLPLGFLSLVLVGSWYVKNKIIFDKLSASSWLGMNLARNVFHDNEITDSNNIAAYAPFSPVSTYKKFIDPGYEKKFKGLNDRDLLQEMKNDSFINENNVNYIPISDLYQRASIQRIKSGPLAYVQNVMQSSILYFTPATVYSLALDRVAKMTWYDVLYSFNLSPFANGKLQRRIALMVSSIPKLLIYLSVLFVLIREILRTRSVSSWNLFILLTIGFVFVISSLFEHYENMRFRFETEPLFLLLAAQAVSILYKGKKIR